MAFNMKYNKGVSIKRVVSKLAITVLTLYVGGTILNEIGGVMNGTASPFYPGLELIGWGVGPGSEAGCSANATATTICNTGGSGILTVVGLVGVAAIVMEFVSFSF